MILCSSLSTRPMLILTCTLLLVLINIFGCNFYRNLVPLWHPWHQAEWLLHWMKFIKQRYYGVPFVLKLLIYFLGKDKFLANFVLINGLGFSIIFQSFLRPSMMKLQQVMNCWYYLLSFEQMGNKQPIVVALVILIWC